MTTSSLRRSMKNIVNNYTEAEIKVREATSNDPWGPPSSLMMEIADLTFNVVAFTEVMGMVWKRLNDHGKNWRHVYKALTLLDYLIKTGSERVAQQCRENVYAIQTLRDFQYIDRDGQDQGANVREKAKQLVSLLRDEEKLRQERSQAQKTRERMAGASSVMAYGSLPPPYPGHRTSQSPMTSLQREEYVRSRGSPSSYNSSSSSPHLAPELEQARPHTSGEEELQLQLALAMSREESEKQPPPVDIDEQTQLQIAMSLSKEEAQKKVVPPPAVALDMDEETQLQIALSLSKEEHQQEQRSRQGDESLLQKALEESKREMEAKGGGSAMLDLVDIFAPASEVPPGANPWDMSGAGAQVQAAGPLRSDLWDSMEPSSSSRSIGSPWMAPMGSSAHHQPWDHQQRPPDPWETPQNVTSPVPQNQSWLSPAPAAATGVDPFSPPTADNKCAATTVKSSSPRPGSPSDGDLFDEAMDGGQLDVNGRSEESPELFDMSRLGESLAEPAPRTCRTPQAFLGPAAASLVNFDSLIPSNPAPKNLNPFLAGMSAPSTTNPFQSEPPRLTLNQMRPSSTSPAPTSLPYSASLPLPASNQPSSLPSSLTQPAQRPMDMPGNLPQPLLPLASASTLGQQDNSQNPFL
ncbi:epsin-3 isoform X1 [Pygocentrus nattereri]|uniref:ENTH domain-containing protein n=1 Tax=Pygocentrus nattereri TaxID=42514 RepID=A0AAR2KGS0_PYGNA|nr:epsin-3 isoform X1 [Pygocentrus nattereri]